MVSAPSLVYASWLILHRDNPVARFGEGRGHFKYYTNFFGRSGLNSPSICAYALENAQDWERRIWEWQNPILSNEQLPRSYKSLLFNELYYLVDGGSIWTVLSSEEKTFVDDNAVAYSIDDSALISPEADKYVDPVKDLKQTELLDNEYEEVRLPASVEGATAEQSGVISGAQSLYGLSRDDLVECMKQQSRLRLQKESMIEFDERVKQSEGEQSICGRFLYLEGHEYLMYNTYDVHFYASFAILKLWPMIDLSIQRDYAIAVYLEDLSVRKMLGHGPPSTRKIKGSVPHDLGSPSEDPWHKVNIYNFQDVCNWKDLGPKFVLQVYRDFVHTRAFNFLRDMYPVVLDIMRYTQK